MDMTKKYSEIPHLQNKVMELFEERKFPMKGAWLIENVLYYIK